MPALFDDVRYGFRMLRKSPGAAAVAVLALGLGIGANTASFISLRAMVLRPLPFPDLAQVVTLWEAPAKNRTSRDPVSPANFLDWKEQTRSFQRVAAYQWWDVNLTGVDDPERLQGYLVSPDFFPLLGMAPERGRGFAATEAQPGHEQVVVLSHGFWARRFSSDPHVLGRTVSLDGRAFTVVGVMPAEFDFPLTTDVWAPLALTVQDRAERGSHYLQVLGRLGPGASLDQARAEMATVTRRIERQYPQTNDGRGANVVRLRDMTNEMTDRFVIILMASSSFVLLLACANVANIHLARGAARAKEFAVRSALGAGRWRVSRQLLIEAVLVSLAGGVLAAFFAVWDTAHMRATIPAQVSKWVAGVRDIKVDGPILAFTLFTALATGLLCGLASAIQAGRNRDLNETLKQGGRSSSASEHHSLRNTLVVSEVAMATVLMVGAGLMVKAFDHIAAAHPGYNPSHLLSMGVALQEARYSTPDLQRSFFENVRSRLENTPSVAAASVAGDGQATAGFQIEGRPAPEASDMLPGAVPVSADYFRALELPLRHGRPIAAQDSADAPRVIVLGEAVVRRYWKSGEDPIGSRVRLGGPQSPWLTVVGVAGDTKNWFENNPIPQVYTSFSQNPQRSARLLLRTHGDPLRAIPAARAEVAGLDRSQPVYDVKSMEQNLADMMSGVRISASWMMGTAIFALILAVSGTYAVIAYSAARRTHEMGVRVALGAAPRDVLRLVVGQALKLALGGLAVGLPAAYGLSRVMSSAVRGVISLDWTVFAGLSVVILASAALAGYMPARRAAAVDPLTALRCE
jgi:putative ABC transport system permease protein